MKRLIPSSIIAVLIIVGCIIGHYIAEKECAAARKQLKECKEAFINGDYTTATEIAIEMKNNWEESEEKLAIFVNHSFLDQISENLAELPYYLNEQNHSYGLSKISGTEKILKHIEEHQSLVPESFY
ncbi:MAG: DUF4363 family protein [Clostridia bacterium]|nr:DUF4363 family protein [Clostridia bacterium]